MSLLKCTREWCGGSLTPDSEEPGSFTCIACGHEFAETPAGIREVRPHFAHGSREDYKRATAKRPPASEEFALLMRQRPGEPTGGGKTPRKETE